jgi:hypothetical protein
MHDAVMHALFLLHFACKQVSLKQRTVLLPPNVCQATQKQSGMQLHALLALTIYKEN